MMEQDYVENLTVKTEVDFESHEKVWLCSFCDAKFTGFGSDDALNNHIKGVHDKLHWPPKKVETKLCNICGKTYSRRHLKDHVDRMHGTEKLSCQYCNKLFKSQYSLKKHIKSNCNREPCLQCGAMIAQERMKRHHILWHSPYENRPFKCQYCEKRYLDHGTLTRHIQEIHLIGSYRYLPYSNSSTENHKSGYHVTNNHLSERKYKCELCNSSYKRRDHLTRHENNVHQIISTESGSHWFGYQVQDPGLIFRKFKCELCSQSYKRRDGLNRHRKNLHQIVPAVSVVESEKRSHPPVNID